MIPRGKSRKWIATNAYYFRIYFVKPFCLERGLFLGMTGFKHGPGLGIPGMDYTVPLEGCYFT